MEKPSTSNSETGSPLSSAYSGMPAARISCSMSPHGANTRSHQTPGIRFMTWYRMRIPMFDMPIS